MSLDYLLEVRSEEIPARMLESATRRLATRIFEDLMGNGVAPEAVETAYTPRRLVLVLRGLPTGEPDREEQMIGPPARVAWDADGRPTKALEGFARRLGIAPEEMARVTTDKGEYAAITRAVIGRPTREILAEIVPREIAEIPWPKTMRWGEGRGPWVRPVHGVVSLLGGEPVPFELFGIAAGDRTAGHPILSPEEITVSGPDDYRARLAERGLVIDPRERSRHLAAEMAERAAAAGGVLVADAELLAKLVGICEIPGVMEGAFDPAYLELPREVLIASLKDHQSAFTVEIPPAGDAGDDEAEGASGGELLPRFLTVMDRADDPAGRVRAGNQWVVDARLADARFFYGEDRKRPLAARAGDLAALGFHAGLGSYAEKAERLAALAGIVCDALGWAEEREAAVRAAGLAKIDLVTEMVKELTDLQGVMGGVYAREDGEPAAVWQAIYDQYLPAAADDALPRGKTGAVVALADRIDSLVGIFGLGLVPTGSADPFALRRAAQGVVRICLENGLPIDLLALAREAIAIYGDRLERSEEEIVADLTPFLADRVRHLLGLRGFAYDEIEAGLAASEGIRHLPDLEARIEALHASRDQPGFLSVVLAAKRIANISKSAPAAGADDAIAVDRELFEPGERAEEELFRAAEALYGKVTAASGSGAYENALRETAKLAEVLDRFFDKIMVMAEDTAVRTNRLALLRYTERAISGIARLTEMVVDKEEHRRRHEGS